jgi:Ran GTPase-activating protein (RanGAP) involved in mRNA processing and transport
MANLAFSNETKRYWDAARQTVWTKLKLANNCFASCGVLQEQLMSRELETSGVAILSRVIQPDSGDWSQAAAEAILGMGFQKTDQEHMGALLEKAEAGNLTDDESEVLENYRHIGKLLELMKSRARRSLGVNSTSHSG